MKNTIIDLWYGNLSPIERSGNDNSEMKSIINILSRNEEKLYKILNDEQKELFEKHNSLLRQYSNLAVEEAFCDGFSIAGRLFAESLVSDK